MQTDALSPLDGRYKDIVQPLTAYFSEAALISKRIEIEVRYLLFLSEIKIVRPITVSEKKVLQSLFTPTQKDILRVKEIEQTTHHDVKAVEYFIREQLDGTSLASMAPFVHFGLTSDDINNCSYALLIQEAVRTILVPKIHEVISLLVSLMDEHKALVCLARTHGQAALPTTMGKEIAVFAVRIARLVSKIEAIELSGKLNGAVGGFHAMNVAFPKIDWIIASRKFVTSLGLTPSVITTQINTHDDMLELFSHFSLLGGVLIGLNQDCWRYISDGWFVQKGKKGHVGSSTMPQKVNPIEFENSEGNLQMANALFEVFCRKLPVSRLQHDLSDSTVLRNIGSAFGYNYLALVSLLKGMRTIDVDRAQIHKDLLANWNILTEALQTIGRKQGSPDAYEQAAKHGKQKVMNKNDWEKIAGPLGKPLSSLTPQTYIGLSREVVAIAKKEIHSLVKERRNV